jgi:acetyl-CoA acetyltransferase
MGVMEEAASSFVDLTLQVLPWFAVGTLTAALMQAFVEQIDVWEVHEAYGAQTLAVLRQLPKQLRDGPSPQARRIRGHPPGPLRSTSI